MSGLGDLGFRAKSVGFKENSVGFRDLGLRA